MPRHPTIPGPGATPDELTAAARTRADAFAAELYRRHPRAHRQLAEFADRNGATDLGSWPSWCWVPMAGSIAVASRGKTPLLEAAADGAKIHAVAAWQLTKGVYTIGADVAADAVAEFQESRGIPRDRILEHLPEHSVYVALPALPGPVDARVAETVPLGMFVTLEHDMNTGRPELRYLYDTDGTWSGLTPSLVYLDRKTLDASARDFSAQVDESRAGRRGTDVSRLHHTDQSRLLGAVTDMGWPVVLALVAEGAVISNLDTPGRTPARARRTGSRWTIAPQTSRWLVSYAAPRPSLRVV
jgi:hypothetical protein